MATKIQLLQEAERRGLLSPDKIALLREAERRGLGEEPKDLAGEAARPFLRTAKQVAVGTLGSAGDIAQQAYYAPEAIARGTLRGLGFKDVEPFDYSKLNTASPAVREAFDIATGGLTEPRTPTEEKLEVAGEIAGGIIGPGAIKTAAQKTADVASLVSKRAVQAGAGITKKSEELVKAFIDSGVRPTLANITEGKATKAFQNLIGNFPGGKGAIEKAAQDQIDDITKQLAGITKSRGGTIQQTGKVLQEGAKGIKEASKARVEKLFDDLDKFIPEGTAAQTDNLRTVIQDPQIQDVAAVGAGDTAKVLKRLNQIVDESGNISYPRLKIFRSTLGAKIQSPTISGDEKLAINKIYAALSKDMKAAVTAQGGARGLQAFNKANNAFARQSDLFENTIDPLIKADVPEKVFNMALSGTKQGGTNVRRIMKRLKPEQQDFIRATVTKRMGLATPGQQDAFGEVFSPDKFLTEWNRLSPEARANIFTKGQITSVNKLNKAISSIKEAGKARQTSNNLPYWAYAGLGGVTVASPVVGLGAVAGANITSRMMTNPRFVTWLAQVPKVRPAQIPKHLKSLSIISSAGNAELREDILNYLENITIEKE